VANAALQLPTLSRGHTLGGVELLLRRDPSFDGLSEADLIVLGQQIVPTDVFEVEADEVFVVAVLATSLQGLSGHCITFRVGCLTSVSARWSRRANIFPTPEAVAVFPAEAGRTPADRGARSLYVVDRGSIRIDLGSIGGADPAKAGPES